MHRHSTSEPLPLPSDDLLDLLRHLAYRDDVPDTVRADARTYLEYLRAAGYQVTLDPVEITFLPGALRQT
ncbi:MAG TPA: hypothetical protein VF590_11375, partial [Isosphaeraceae bacterium]